MKNYLKILWLFLVVSACKNEEEILYTEYKNIEEIIAVETIELTKIEDGKFYNPKFTASGNKIVFTTDTFTGLWYYDFKTKIVNQLNPSIGAGINFDISKVDEKVYFRLQSTSAKGNIKHFSIAEQDIETKMINILYTSRTNVGEPKALSDGNITFLVNEEIKIFNKDTKNFIENYEPENIIAFANGSSIKIKFKNIDKEIIPLPDSEIVWIEISPLNDKIYFNCSGKGTGVYTLKSNEIKWLGEFRYLTNSRNCNLMVYSFYQNGSGNFNYDLYISADNNLNKFNITNTSAENEMFPCWSHDGNQIVYNTADGKIKMTKLKIKSGSNV